MVTKQIVYDMVFDSACIAEEAVNELSDSSIMAGAVVACTSKAIEGAAADFAFESQTVFVPITVNSIGTKELKGMAGKAKGAATIIVPGLTKGFKDKKKAEDTIQGAKIIFEFKATSGAVDVAKYLDDNGKLPEGDLPDCVFQRLCLKLDENPSDNLIKATQLVAENDPNKAISGEITLAKANSKDSWDAFWSKNE